MPNRIAITWENDRLTLLAANVHGGTANFGAANIIHAETFLVQNGPLAGQVSDFVQQHRLQKSEVLVVMSRSDVEVRPMLFPPVPVEELPDLVAFQAAKEFNGYDAAAPLDFFITNKLDFLIWKEAEINLKIISNVTPPGAPKHLIASTLRTSTLKKIEDFCDETNLTLRRILLRPCETAFLLRRLMAREPGHCALLVELDASEISQAVLFQGEPVFMRSPRIACPEDVSTSDFVARLLAELKRTRIAVRNEIQGVSVSEIELCGVGAKFDSLARQLADSLDITVKMFDPWIGLTAADFTPPERPERFAPLLGALLRDAKNEPGDIDFCHPKKREEPAGKRRLVTGILAASLLLLIGLLGYGLFVRMSLDKEVRLLSNQLTSLRRTAATVTEQRHQLDAVDAWLADDVDWFAQLDWLSRSAPGAQDMILTELTLSADNAGSMRMKSFLKDASVVSPMEERLREGAHDIQTGEKRESVSNVLGHGYGFLYDLTVSLSREKGKEKPAAVEKETQP